MSTGRSSYRTKGLAFLTPEEQKQLARLLRKTGTSYRRVHTKEGDELVLLKITATGVIPQIVKFLSQFGVDIIDRFTE